MNNPNGFVLNVRRVADPEYVVLHHASCSSISTDRREPGAYRVLYCRARPVFLRTFETIALGLPFQSASRCLTFATGGHRLGARHPGSLTEVTSAVAMTVQYLE